MAISQNSEQFKLRRFQQLSQAQTLWSRTETARMSLMMVQMQSALPHARSTRVRAHAVTTDPPRPFNARWLAGASYAAVQQTYGDKKLKEADRESAMAGFEQSMKEHTASLDEVWAQSRSLRVMQMVLRHKKKHGAKDDKWSQVHELPGDDDEMPDFDNMQAATMGNGPLPPPPPPKPPSKTPRQKREASGEVVGAAECADAGPWPCEEQGCPAATIGCADLKEDCTAKFSDVFSSPPVELADTRVWTKCPKSCDRCKAKKEKKSKKVKAGKRKDEL